MLASLLISVISLVLFVYWFRYSCLLVLRNETERAQPVHDNRLGLYNVSEKLSAAPDLDSLHVSLERDYRLLTYLIHHAARLGEQSVEDRILMIDYNLMRVWYHLTRAAAPEQARRALAEMGQVVSCLSRKIGEQAGLQPEI
jgi:hypothetical protein